MEALNQIENYLRGLNRVLVALSGGVDSALLAFLARNHLGRENMIAITGDSASVPSEDRKLVQVFCQTHDIPHRFILTYEQNDPNYRTNPENRCFFCKEELYRRLKEYAVQWDYPHVLDGTNLTDLKGHRPGFEALRKAEIKTPYVELKIDKAAIRAMAKYLNLEIADKPQSACLASRIPTGTPIDVEAMQKVDQAENSLRQLGLKQSRVRFHGELARLELRPEEWTLCLEKKDLTREVLQSLGFKFITLDLHPYDRAD